MKRRLALGALLVLGGIVSIAAALMFTGFVKTPEALATVWYHDLVQGKKEVVVGQIQVDNLDNHGATLKVRYSTDSPWCLTEVHVCVSNLPFEWVAPGSEKKCEDPPPKGLGGFYAGVELDECEMAYDVVIPLDELGGLETLCPSVNIQAHAVVRNECTGKEETAYGKDFKASFDQPLCYCTPYP
jgi:hypothetical protein